MCSTGIAAQGRIPPDCHSCRVAAQNYVTISYSSVMEAFIVIICIMHAQVESIIYQTLAIS
jgi:hypothetical protein